MPPATRLAVTGYRLLNTFLCTSFFSIKAVCALKADVNPLLSSMSDWTLGGFMTVIMWWIGYLEALDLPSWRWFFHYDYLEISIEMLQTFWSQRYSSRPRRNSATLEEGNERQVLSPTTRPIEQAVSSAVTRTAESSDLRFRGTRDFLWPWARKPKASQRRFIDLIWTASNKWAVWDPPSEIVNLGDYGGINEESGNFECEGNIFQNPECADAVAIVPSTSSASRSTDRLLCITSAGARQVSPEGKFAVDAQDASLEFEGAWEFDGKSAAVLVISEPHQATLSREVKYEILEKRLPGKCIVTSVTTCPAYALYFAPKGTQYFSLALAVKTPVPTTPVTAKPEGAARWLKRYSGGVYREGSNTEPSFTVLYGLRRCKLKKAEDWLKFR